MALLSVAEIARAIAGDETVTHGPMQVYVVNFYAPQEYPRRFVYTACSKKMPSGRLCGKSCENGESCQHHPIMMGTTFDQFRFEVIVVDAFTACRPLNLMIFEAASSFLNLTALLLKNMQDEDQSYFVRKAVQCTPLVEVFIRVQGGKGVVTRCRHIGEAAPHPAIVPPPVRAIRADLTANTPPRSPSASLRLGATLVRADAMQAIPSRPLPSNRGAGTSIRSSAGGQADYKELLTQFLRILKSSGLDDEEDDTVADE